MSGDGVQPYSVKLAARAFSVQFLAFSPRHNRSTMGDMLSYEQRLSNFRAPTALGGCREPSVGLLRGGRFRAAVERHNSRADVSWTAAPA